ncbi:unnamed protein product, partial [Strongylus vulgaris]
MLGHQLIIDLAPVTISRAASIAAMPRPLYLWEPTIVYLGTSQRFNSGRRIEEECVTYHLQIDQSIEDRSAAPRAVQRKLCREAAQLFEHHGAIVAPQQDYEVFVIVARCTFLEGKEFLDWLRNKFLKIVGTNRADTQMIEKCLHYTLTLWLAPHHYYTVGKTLVTGLIFGAVGPKLIRL